MMERPTWLEGEQVLPEKLRMFNPGSARGVHAVMEKISFLFGIMLAEKVFSLTDTLTLTRRVSRNRDTRDPYP